MHAGVAELVDAPDSKSGSFGSVGSIPTLGTIGLKTKLATAGFFLFSLELPNQYRLQSLA